MIFLKIFKAFIIVIFTLAEYVKPYFFFLQNNLYFFLFSILLIIFVFIFIYILRFLYKKFNLYFAKYFYIKINNKYKIKLAAITVAPGLLLIIGADSLINNEFAENIQIIGDRFVSFVKLITDYAATLDLELPKPSVSGNGV
jgi:membrane protease YdiL (CAAX protease family)